MRHFSLFFFFASRGGGGGGGRREEEDVPSQQVWYQVRFQVRNQVRHGSIPGLIPWYRSCLDGRLKNCYNQQQQQHSRESGPCSTLLPYRYEYNILLYLNKVLTYRINHHQRSKKKVQQTLLHSSSLPASLSFFIVLLL